MTHNADLNKVFHFPPKEYLDDLVKRNDLLALKKCQLVQIQSWCDGDYFNLMLQNGMRTRNKFPSDIGDDEITKIDLDQNV